MPTLSTKPRTGGGISGTGGKNVAPVYKNPIGSVINSIKKNWSKPIYTPEELRSQREFRKSR